MHPVEEYRLLKNTRVEGNRTTTHSYWSGPPSPQHVKKKHKMSASLHPITLDELFGTAIDASSRGTTKPVTSTTASTAAAQPTSENEMNSGAAAGPVAPPQTRERQGEKSSSPSSSSSFVRVLRGGGGGGGDGGGGGRDFTTPISSLTNSAVNRLRDATPSTSAFSDMASEAVTAVLSDDSEAFTTVALLRRFLDERRRIAAESGQTQCSSFSHATQPSALLGSPAFGALRTAHLVPSVIPAVTAAEANAAASEPEGGPYLVESAYMRASIVTTVLKRQKAERHAAYSAAHSFFHSQTQARPASAPPTRLPAVLDMPLHLRCAMCQKHDALCNRCHRRWGKLQDAYREEAAMRCYRTLDVNRRGALGLLTAALGTGSFLEMMSIADGLTLTQRRVRVAPASLGLLLKSCGRVLSTVTEERLSHAEDASLPSPVMWLKVAHMGCLFGQRDVLRSLWLRCRGGCSYAAQITTNGLHALELLTEPYESELQTVMNRCAALREYLLWARIIQCLAVRAATVVKEGGDRDDDSDAEATQLCAELRNTGSWVGIWCEALLAYVKGNRESCVELCDELLKRAAQSPTPALDGETDAPAAHRAALPAAMSAVSFSSSALEALTPLQQPSSTPTTPPAQAADALEKPSMRPVMDADRIRGLRELALQPAAAVSRSEETEEEEEAPSMPVHLPALKRSGDGGVEDTAATPSISTKSVVCLSVRRLPFGVMRRILSYCDASTLLGVHEATAMPLLRWMALARLKCLPPAQWTVLLTANVGYAALMHALCAYVPPPTLSREDQEDTELEGKKGEDEGGERDAAGTKAATRAGAAVAMACPPFQPLHLSVVDIDDLCHITVKAVTLSHKTAERKIVPDEPLTVGQWLLQSLFGRATSLVSESKYLVLSQVYRLTAPDNASNLANGDVSTWVRTAKQPWEVDTQATIRWCTYIQKHAEAQRLL